MSKAANSVESIKNRVITTRGIPGVLDRDRVLADIEFLLAEIERLQDENALAHGAAEYHAERAERMDRERNVAMGDLAVMRQERDEALRAFSDTRRERDYWVGRHSELVTELAAAREESRP